MSETTEALIERVLGAHAYNDWPTCTCEWDVDIDAILDDGVAAHTQHRHHVAAAIAEALAEVERERHPLRYFDVLRSMSPSPELTTAIDAAEETR